MTRTENSAELMAEIESQTCAPPGGDPIIANMWDGFLTETSEDSGLRDIFETFLQVRVSGSPSERAGLLRTIFMADVLRGNQAYHEAIPQSYEAWCDYFARLGSDYRQHDDSSDTELGNRIEELELNILDISKEVQTNIAGRYVSAELAMQTEPKFQDGVVWLDVGCGIQQGQHALALKDRFPLGQYHTIGERTFEPLPELAAKVAELLARPSLIKSGVGLDLFDPKDSKSKRWVRASLRPTTELMNPEFMARYDALADADAPNVTAQAVDITDTEAVTKFLDENPDFQPNLVTLYTFPHQLEKHERPLSARNIRRIAAPDATLLLQDFAYASSPRPNSLRYYGNWHIPFRYATFRRELGSADDYWQKQMSFNESHGNVLKLSAAMIKRVMSA